MKSLIFGGSAGLGRAMSERLARAGHSLFLISSDIRDAEPLAADLRLRFGVQVVTKEIDLAAAFDLSSLRHEVATALGSIDNLFYLAGVSDVTAKGPLDDDVVQKLINVNFTVGVRVINAFLSELANNEHGNIVGAGSIAAIRGRSRNAIYAAAKRGLEFYFDTLRHYLAGRPCRMQFYRLGYMKTRMTQGQALLFPAISPDQAADRMFANLGKDTGVRYLPAWWGSLAALLRIMPWVVFKRLDF